MKQFVKQEANKKRIKMYVVDQAHLLQTIATTFPMPATFTDKVHPLKDSIDVLIRSDPKVLGMDLYSIASIPGIIRLEHKVDYLAMLAEERHGSVSVSISRASEANYVDFILQQILSASAGDLKGEMNITLINEPGLGVGVTREFFQIVQRCFFQSDPSSLQARTSPPEPAPHVRDIGAQWLQLARSQGRRNGRSNKKGGDLESAGRSKGRGAVRDGSFVELFPLFEFADKQRRDVLRIAPRTVYVSKSTMDAKLPEKSLSLTRKDLLVNHSEVETLKKVYLCIGRLIGLAIRNHQPLAADFPLAFWKFLMQDNSLSWEDYCGSSQVFKRSLQFMLDHDFEAEPLDMRFEYTMDVVVVDDESGVSSEGAEQEEQQQQELHGDAVSEQTSPAASVPSAFVSMEMELQKGMGDVAVTNINKKEYVRLRAQQFFFGNEFVYYKTMRDGFLDTIARSDLKLFHPAELRRVVRGEPSIDFSSLKKSVLYSRGASPLHGAIQRFWEVVEDFDQETRAKLLTFWSGSPLPPIFGFESKYRSMNAVSLANDCLARFFLVDWLDTHFLIMCCELCCAGHCVLVH
ncbi:hypothetical protein BBJ28_00006231 [Nothophytophthora sp. Chile5]|nr:hypothetical protein BBJ28_00006231 [Nothophytophthora sp. Chile5]